MSIGTRNMDIINVMESAILIIFPTIKIWPNLANKYVIGIIPINVARAKCPGLTFVSPAP